MVKADFNPTERFKKFSSKGGEKQAFSGAIGEGNEKVRIFRKQDSPVYYAYPFHG